MDLSHFQYKGGTSSVQWRVDSAKEGIHYRWCVRHDLSHHQHGGGCAVHDYQNCSGDCWWLYLSGKMTTLLYLRFYPTVIVSKS